MHPLTPPLCCRDLYSIHIFLESEVHGRCCIGLVASLQANDLPNPVVEVCVLDNHAYKAYEIAAARTLQVDTCCA